MFGLSKSSNEQSKKDPVEEVAHDIGVIPDLFYGGNDPDIYVEKVTKPKDVVSAQGTPEKQEPVQKKEIVTPTVAPPRRLPPPPLPQMAAAPAPDGATAPASPVKMTTPPPVQSKKGIVFVILLVVIALVGVGAWYYLTQYVKTPVETVDNTLPPVQNEVPVVVPPPVVNPSVVTSTIATSTFELPPTPTSSIQRERSLPPFSLSSAPDSENDKLSAPEEELFQTDPEVWDTDSDGYYDGQEVYNLYNPKGIAPMKIIDSGLVQDYINPHWQYRVYYPTSWQATSIDDRTNDDVLFNAISGDYVQVKVYQKQDGESFAGWFGRVVNDQIYSDLVPGTNRFSVPFMRRKDGLVTYFDTPKEVYIIILYSQDETVNNFSHVVDMMAQSFRPAKVRFELPPQPVLPVPPSATTATSSFIQDLLNNSNSNKPTPTTTSVTSSVR